MANPRSSILPARKVSNFNLHVLWDMEEKLRLKAYSQSTIRIYLNEMSQLLAMLGDIPAENLRPEHLKRYLIFCFEKLGLKENTLHSRINAMKFYYEQVLGREKFFWDIPRPKKQIILPKVLNETEIGRLFRGIRNLKHKAVVFTAYSAGLRVSEVVSLKISDVDSQRMTLFIERAKGKKDRVVNLSPLLLDILRVYIKKCNPRPLKYLFEGERPGEPYSIRSAQQVFLTAKRRAGIDKNVSFHALRHSFATHLLEKGVDIKYIKDILGHFDIRTTERYTHVSRNALVNIVSPLDDLYRRGVVSLPQ
jgi:integrase/recombinase XerD